MGKTTVSLLTLCVFALLCGWAERKAMAQQDKPPGVALYVSLNGNDAWSGRLAEPNAEKTDGPFRTLAKAAGAMKAGDTCLVREGVYRETLTLYCSGVTVQNYRDEIAVISGADLVTGWRSEGGAVYSAEMGWDLDDQNQLFADGLMLTEARWPNNTGTLLQPVRATVASGTANTITDPNLPGGDDSWKGALLACAGGSAWQTWAAKVVGYDARTKTLTFNPPQPDKWYSPTKGNAYALMGVRNALDAEGEWWADHAAKRLYLWAPGGKDPNSLRIEAKRRAQAIVLSGCSNVRIIGLQFRVGGILTDEKSSDILLKGLKGEYLGHSYKKDISATGSVVVHGRGIEVNSCEFAWSSGSLVHVRGDEHRIINCYIHDGDYAGMWGAALVLAGRRLVVSHNTVRDSGRDIISTGGLTESIVEYNDLSHAGWLTRDLGMTYGCNTDFQNTVFRYNLVHDNMAKACGAGIYFDHLSINAIVYRNVFWNIPNDPVRFNNPGYFDLAFNNTTWHSGWQSKRIGSFDHSNRNDLFGTRFYNNIVNVPFKLPAHVFMAGNVISEDPGFVNPADLRFDLKADSAAIGAGIPIAGVTEGARPDAGALQHGQPMWNVGHDFAHPPEVPAWKAPDIAYMNGLKNSCFEYGIEDWTKTGAGKAQTTPGNGWGNGWGRGEVEPTGTCRAELRLGGGRDGVEQTVSGLFPDTAYTLSGWVKVKGAGEKVRIGARDFGGDNPETAAESDSATWVRLIVEFKTGPANTEATVFVEKTSDGPGYAFADNLGLPKRPKGTEWERPVMDMRLKPVRIAKVLPPPFTARRVAQPVTVDGKVSPGEWPDAALELHQSPSREILETPPCVVKACHDGNTLYVTVTVPVKDAAKLKRGGKWETDDGAEVCFAEEKGGPLGPIFVVHGFTNGQWESVTEAGAPAPQAKALGAAVRYAATVGDKQWTGEWAIPLSTVGIQMTPGKRIAFNAGVHRSETDEWVIWIGALGQTWRLKNAGTLILE